MIDIPHTETDQHFFPVWKKTWSYFPRQVCHPSANRICIFFCIDSSFEISLKKYRRIVSCRYLTLYTSPDGWLAVAARIKKLPTPKPWRVNYINQNVRVRLFTFSVVAFLPRSPWLRRMKLSWLTGKVTLYYYKQRIRTYLKYVPLESITGVYILLFLSYYFFHLLSYFPNSIEN